MRKYLKFIIIAVVIIVIFAIVAIIIVKGNGKEEGGSSDVENFFTTSKEGEGSGNNDKSKQEKIKDFLTSNNLISKSKEAENGYPVSYYFLNNGKFVYTIGEEYVTQKGQAIGFCGTWSIEDNKLILKCEELKTAKGGKSVKETENAKKHIENYEEEISEINYVKEFEIKDFSNDFIQLDDDKYYKVNAEDEYIESLEEIANYGY